VLKKICKNGMAVMVPADWQPLKTIAWNKTKKKNRNIQGRMTCLPLKKKNGIVQGTGATPNAPQAIAVLRP
jgi:hypothetical protein